MGFILLYIFLIISLILAKLNGYFYILSAFVLASPLIFYKLDKFGLFLIKGIIYGFAASAVYFPFLNLNLIPFNQITQVFLEEVFFRGYIQNEFFKKFNIHISILLTSILFTIPHLIVSFSLLSFLTFFPSIIFGYLYYYSKSIWTSAIFHFFSNWFFFSNYMLIQKII